MSKAEAVEESAASASDLDPAGQASAQHDPVTGERTLLSGSDFSDKDAYGPPVSLLPYARTRTHTCTCTCISCACTKPCHWRAHAPEQQ